MSDEQKYIAKYLDVMPICQKCDLFYELDEECLMVDRTIMQIVKSDYPICPIGDW